MSAAGAAGLAPCRAKMASRSGRADLPLHGGRVPRWLADRMTRLGAVMTEAIVHHYGRDEFLEHELERLAVQVSNGYARGRGRPRALSG